MSRIALIRLLETFFRRPWLYLIPLVLAIGLAAFTVTGSEDEFKSGGVVSVNSDTLLSNLSDVTIEAPFTFETPASVTSRRINDLLGSTGFVLTVAEAAGLVGALESGVMTLDDVRTTVSAAPVGDALVSITATTSDPEASFRLANATIDSFIALVVDDAVEQSRSPAEFYDDLAADYQTALAAASEDLDNFVQENEAPVIGERPIDQLNAIARLTAAETFAQDQFASALAKAEEARLVAEQTRLDIDQRVNIVDEPGLPFAPEPNLRRMVLTVLLLVVVGVIGVLALVALAAAFDRSVRDREGVEARLAIPILGSVPIDRSTTRRRRPDRRRSSGVAA
ncbi:MAG: hypothetical protein ABJ314_15840 [Ilumatobacter sp.]|uniref:hypothetical protein n=1 Tax=Ilumatobacter sp. TaxID=1967498 RepID=UPI0032968906